MKKFRLLLRLLDVTLAIREARSLIRNYDRTHLFETDRSVDYEDLVDEYCALISTRNEIKDQLSKH